MDTIKRLTPRAFLALAAVIGLCAAGVAASSAPTLMAAFVDVGQGDCIVLELPGGGAVLVDAGEARSAPAVLGFLSARGIRRLDLVVATHPHADHVGGLDRVLRSVQVGRLVYNGQQGASGPAAAFWSVLAELGIPNSAPHPSVLVDQAGATVRLIWPTPMAAVAWDSNNASVVLRVQFRSIVLLLTGDIESRAETALLSTDRQALDCDVLKVAHHGSRGSSSAEFLRAASPSVAVICVGASNLYGHPHPETLERLRSTGARVYRTDVHGTVMVQTDGQHLSTRITRARAARTGQRRKQADSHAFMSRRLSTKVDATTDRAA